MDNNKFIWNSVFKLYNYSEENKWKGYDPYDSLNSIFTQQICKNNEWLRIFTIQFNKISLINFRSLLNIKKGIDVKGSGLFASALIKLYRLTGEKKYLDNAYYLLDFLRNNSLKKDYSEHCWGGHYFDIQFPKEETKPNDPSTIGTVTCALAFLEDYITTGKKKSLEIVKSATDFLINNLYVEANNKSFFKYLHKSKTNNITYNASTHAVMLLSNTYRFYQDERYVKISKKVMNFILSKQKYNGSWFYSETNGKERIQIDFHQGFILDSLIDFIKYIKPKEKKYLISLRKGSKFYKDEQFLPDGIAKYRWPKLYPIDIHNQAQGIITFSKLSKVNLNYIDFSKRIVSWTINNMQDKNEGYFYYQIWPAIKNKISYMRWSQAWMMLALTSFLEMTNIGETVDVEYNHNNRL